MIKKYYNKPLTISYKTDEDSEPIFQDVKGIFEFEKCDDESEEKPLIEINSKADLEKLYGIDINKLPDGIANMLKGFQKGYANLQMMILTLYFKNRGYLLEDIVSILYITKNISKGKWWNTWDLEEEVKRIYNNYVNKFILEELQDLFGTLIIDYNTFVKIPIGFNPKQTKLYIFLLLNGSCKKKDILKGLGISNNKVDRLIEDNNLVQLENRIFSIKEQEFDTYVLIDKNELEILNSLDYKEIAIYCYLKWRTGIKKYIKVSIQRIKENTNISEHTISDSIKSLEKKGLLKVKRFKYCEHNEFEFYKEMNEYTTLIN